MENRDRFIELLKSTHRKGIDDLIEYLKTTDFFTAPASTKYHCDYEGGLCQHSLNVYDSIMKLRDTFNLNIPNDTLTIVSLLHDISKVNFYEDYIQNRKWYNPNGQKYDENGNFDWVSVKTYKIKEPELRFLAGDHGYNSVALIRGFINISLAEEVAILNHHAGMDNNFCNRDLNSIYNRYQLAPLLHLADMLSVYILENNEQQN